jgi:hypothetical protein
MPFFALFMLYAYRTTPYKRLASSAAAADTGSLKQGGPLGIRAYLEALLITDLISAFVRGPMRLLRETGRNLANDSGKEETFGLVNGAGRLSSEAGNQNQPMYDPNAAQSHGSQMPAYGVSGQQQTGYTGAGHQGANQQYYGA